MSADLIPPQDLMESVGSSDAAHFQAIGNRFFEIFTKYGGLRPTDRVLDVGCGCGRMAIPLTRYLTTGSYDGFDILPEPIKWCQQNLSSHYPNFRFEAVDLANSFYNQEGKLRAQDFKFPFRSSSFDFVFLASVFTHMLPPGLQQYMREIRRVLDRRGRAVITFFILNEESERLRIMPESKVSFPYLHSDGRVRVGHPRVPERVVAYPERMVRQLLKRHGLRLVEPIYFGSWCGRRDTVTFQDVAISEREALGFRSIATSLAGRWNPFR